MKASRTSNRCGTNLVVFWLCLIGVLMLLRGLTFYSAILAFSVAYELFFSRKWREKIYTIILI